MTTPDAGSLAELIADCAEIPASLRTADRAIPLPHTAAGWSVGDACVDQVAQLDEYV